MIEERQGGTASFLDLNYDIVRDLDIGYECAGFKLLEILGSSFRIFTQHDDFNRET